MCKQFWVDDIYVTRETTKYFPKGTIMAKIGADWYLQIFDAAAGTRTPESWPLRINGRIQLWRDYWKYFCDESESNGIYYTELVKVKKDLAC